MFLFDAQARDVGLILSGNTLTPTHLKPEKQNTQTPENPKNVLVIRENEHRHAITLRIQRTKRLMKEFLLQLSHRPMRMRPRLLMFSLLGLDRAHVEVRLCFGGIVR